MVAAGDNTGATEGKKSESKEKQVGNQDTRISNSRKVWISSPQITVVGVFGPGTSQEMSANWESPFENMTVGNMMEIAAGVTQATSGMTSVATFNTQQVWNSNRPTAFTLELKLYALSDPEAEVMKPLAALEYMIAPDTNQTYGVGGQIADAIHLNIGTRVIYKPLVIDSISIPYDKEVDSLGRFVRCTVTIQFSTLTMVSRQMLADGYGMKMNF